MLSLKIWLFGELRIRQGDKVWPWEDGGKMQELFCYLMIQRPMRHNREQLAEVFWCNKAASKKNLRQALWQLQTRCAEYAGDSSASILSTNATWICLNPELDLWTDVGAFEQAYECLLNTEELDAPCAQKLQQAVNLYQGDLLEGWYQDWCLCERERLQNIYLKMLDRLVCYCVAQRDYDAGLDYGERILKYDPARERTHQQIMRLKCLAGDRTGAVRQYDRCAQALSRELGVQPSRRTREMFDRIRADLSPASAMPELLGPPPNAAPTPSRAELLNQLKGFQSTLGALQQQAQQWIKFIEQLDSKNK